MPALTEKEHTVIYRIGNNSGKITQRQIAYNTGLSLGLTNIILKRLAKKGYIKARQLTPKKIQYILTQKGISEKTKKSYNYILKTIRELKNVNSCIQRLFEQAHRSGIRKIGILGDNDSTEIIRLCVKDINNIEMIYFENDFFNEDIQGVDLIIDCGNDNRSVKNSNGQKIINLIDYIVNPIRNGLNS